MDEMIYCLDFFQTYPEKRKVVIHKENKIGYGLADKCGMWMIVYEGVIIIFSLFFWGNF